MLVVVVVLTRKHSLRTEIKHASTELIVVGHVTVAVKADFKLQLFL